MISPISDEKFSMKHIINIRISIFIIFIKFFNYFYKKIQLIN